MRIIPPLPPRAQALVDHYLDLVNTTYWAPRIPLYGRRIEISYIDTILVGFGAIATGYCGWMYGWRGAAYAVLSYALGVMTALWVI